MTHDEARSPDNSYSTRGNVTIYTQMCEQARRESYMEVLNKARRLGSNSIIGMRYGATEIMTALTKALSYGTAVVIATHRA